LIVDMYGSDLSIAQGDPDTDNSPGTERCAVLTYPNCNDGKLIVEFGLVIGFEAQDQHDDQPTPTSHYDALRYCKDTSVITDILVRSLEFVDDDYEMVTSFLFNWLCPENPASA